MSQVFQDKVLMVAGEKMVFLGALEPKVSLERSSGPHLDLQDRTVFQEYLETRASQGHQEVLDHLVLMGAQVFLDRRGSVE